MRYIVEITGPNGNGWYKPILHKSSLGVTSWELVSLTTRPDKNDPIPGFMLDNLFSWLCHRFAFNYSVSLKPYVEDK